MDIFSDDSKATEPYMIWRLVYQQWILKWDWIPTLRIFISCKCPFSQFMAVSCWTSAHPGLCYQVSTENHFLVKITKNNSTLSDTLKKVFEPHKSGVPIESDHSKNNTKTLIAIIHMKSCRWTILFFTWNNQKNSEIHLHAFCINQRLDPFFKN